MTAPALPRVRVLILSPSALQRMGLAAAFGTEPQIEVLPSVTDPALWMRGRGVQPDVVVVDSDTRGIDVLTFTRELARERGVAVIVRCNPELHGPAFAARATAVGASHVVDRPPANAPDGFEGAARMLVPRILEAARHRPRPAVARPAPGSATPGGIGAGTNGTTAHTAHASPSVHVAPAAPVNHAAGAAAAAAAALATATATAAAHGPAATAHAERGRIIAIGASAGGTRALHRILPALGAHSPPILVVQHGPDNFTQMFARTIQAQCQLVVREARDGDPLEPDQVLLAPDRWHMGIERTVGGFKVILHDAPPLHGFRPAVDVMFESVAMQAGRRAAGFLLTGMGADGARGLYEMRRAGAVTYAQDEATSLVWGMPGAAVALGAADHLIALDDVAAEIQRYKG